MLTNNPAYSLELDHQSIKIYLPTNKMEGYHTSRYVEAQNQVIYANSGTTASTLEYAMNAIIERANDTSFKTARTDIAAIANSILYRLKYPVDQHCAVRMGCILSFAVIDDVEEDPNTCQSYWLEKKMALAMKYPDLYAFFLTWGASNLEIYREALDTLNALDYFQKRKEAILTMWGDIEQFKA